MPQDNKLSKKFSPLKCVTSHTSLIIFLDILETFGKVSVLLYYYKFDLTL